MHVAVLRRAIDQLIHGSEPGAMQSTAQELEYLGTQPCRPSMSIRGRPRALDAALSLGVEWFITPRSGKP